MAKYRRYLSVLWLWGLAVCGVVALQAAPADSTAGKVAVSAVWLPGQAKASGELFISTGSATAAPQPITVGSGSRGREAWLDLGAATSFRLLVRVPNPKEGEAPWRSVGEIARPAGSPSARYLLILAVAEGAPAVRGIAIADDAKTFPMGTVRLANLSGAPLLAKVGESAGTYASGLSAPIPYAVTPAANASGATPTFPFILAKDTGVFFNGRIAAWSGSRTLVLIAPNPLADKPPLVKSLIDHPSPAPKS